MIRYLVSCFLLAGCLSCGLPRSPLLADEVQTGIQIDTPDQAAEFAAKLANKRAESAFGKSPFTPQSYSPRRIGSRWHWGEIVPPGIGGYSAEVSFNEDGSDPKVRAVLHTDVMSIIDVNPDRVPIQREILEEEAPVPDSTEKNDR